MLRGRRDWLEEGNAQATNTNKAMPNRRRGKSLLTVLMTASPVTFSLGEEGLYIQSWIPGPPFIIRLFCEFLSARKEEHERCYEYPVPYFCAAVGIFSGFSSCRATIAAGARDAHARLRPFLRRPGASGGPPGCRADQQAAASAERLRSRHHVRSAATGEAGGTCAGREVAVQFPCRKSKRD